MDSIFISPEALSPRTLGVGEMSGTMVGMLPLPFPGVVVAGVAKGVVAGTKPAVQTGFGVTVGIAIVMG